MEAIQTQVQEGKLAKIIDFIMRFSLKSKSEEMTESNILEIELKELKLELDQKEQNFKFAEFDYIEVAIMELEAIRKKYSITLRKLKAITAIS